MKLYYSPTSPFVRKVRVHMLETGLDAGVELITAAGHPIDPGTMPVGVNPLGKVPCLVRDDGPAIYDSRVITRYLDTLADTKLYPPEPTLWDTLTLEATADGMLEATLLIFMELRLRTPEQMSKDWIAGQWSKVSRSFAAIEDRWMDHLSGPLDMGQVAVAVACAYVDLRQPDRNWREDHPALSEWQTEFARRDSMILTQPQ